ncbi:MAG TPA: alpha/beta hydrolase [Ramlibacter sp.]|nr:alpha/beta hydrolase [Ramlibacter sp.]
MPATYVLVHGAWHGGWCWQRVVDRLTAAGARVYAPSLTGLADRAHLLSASVGLHTHVADIVNLMQWEELEELVLVGHSYGGMVCGGVLAAQAPRLKALVLVDAFVPEHGKCLLDIGGPAARQRFESLRYETPAGPCLPPVPARMFRVNEADADWVDRQCTPQPFRSFTDVLEMPGGVDDAVRTRVYLRAAAYPQPVFEAASQALPARGWQVHALPHGHDLMLDAPDAVAAHLLDLS